jgi:NAD(P)-dependent dehydrogenase (short-subunit alcohol dehydrogenase family)
MAPNPNNFSAASIPDLGGKTILVTGGNTGIGYETCLECCRKGAHVYLAARSEQRATDAIEKIKKEIPQAKITFLKLDLQDLKQVQTAAQEFKGKESKLDVLVNNAGIMACPFQLSKDGIETQFATNHVGHFLLTRELLPVLLKTPKSRLVNVSSEAHKWHPKNGIEFDDINNEKAMSNFQRYGQSKLANILFTREFNKRYGDKMYSNSLHPGVVRTELGRGLFESMGPTLSFVVSPILYMFSFFVQIGPKEGALTSLYCATSPDIETKQIKDKYYVPFAKEEEPLAISRDDALATKLWEFTEKLVNEKLSK